MTFNDVIGQDETKDLLRGMVQENRIPHAQIFLGKEGAGGLELALVFAQYILCENRNEKEPCGICSQCIKVSKLVHPDLHFSYPTVGAKVTSTSFLDKWREIVLSQPYFNIQEWLKHIQAENKQGNINKDECAAIVKKLSLKTFEGSHKILIIWLPEYLGKEGNRLLKLIEEPPENTLFILVAENIEAILNTIISRCQIVTLKPLADAEIIKALEQKGIDADKARGIAHLANGNYNQALSLITEVKNDNALLFLQWLRVCYKGVPEEIIEWTDSFSKLGRERQKHLLDYGLFFLREYMVLKLTDSEIVRLGEDELLAANRLKKVIQYRQIEPISNILTEAAFHVSRNANPKILMTDMTVKMFKTLRT